MNAAKWSGAEVVSLFAEVEPAEVSVYVRDRGRGFDPAAVPGDRKGIAESIHARMARRGGSAVVRTRPGRRHRGDAAMPRAAGNGSRAGHEHARHRAHGHSPRVFIVDDHGLFRSGVRAELGDEVDVVGEADDVTPAIELIGELLPDVVLLDVHLPGGGGQAVVSAIQAAASRGAVPGAVGVGRPRGRDRGHPGRRPRLCDQDDLRPGPGRRHPPGRRRGRRVLAPAGRFRARRLRVRRRRASPSLDPELDQLTPREREVLRLIARGYTYKEIARELSISAKTVESHVSSVLRKLQLSTRHQLTRWATERRLA